MSHCSIKEYLAIVGLVEEWKSGQDGEQWWQIGNRASCGDGTRGVLLNPFSVGGRYACHHRQPVKKM
jgi:hypothetical protein